MVATHALKQTPLTRNTSTGQAAQGKKSIEAQIDAYTKRINEGYLHKGIAGYTQLLQAPAPKREKALKDLECILKGLTALEKKKLPYPYNIVVDLKKASALALAAGIHDTFPEPKAQATAIQKAKTALVIFNQYSEYVSTQANYLGIIQNILEPILQKDERRKSGV